jgi:hypothetical protein
MRLYWNGARLSIGSNSYPTIGYASAINTSGNTHYIGYDASPTSYASLYLAEYFFIDGQALEPTYFGEIDTKSGQWIPKAYSGTYGSNGFYLKFADNSNTTATTMGKDSSGQGNNWTPTNFNTYDQVLDSPTNNFCVANPVDFATGYTPAMSGGNLLSGASGRVRGSFAFDAGSSNGIYFEARFSSMATNSGFGILDITKSLVSWFDYDAGLYEVQWWNGGSTLSTYHLSSYVALSLGCTTSDVLQMAIKGGSVWIGKNNSWVGGGNPSTGTNPYWTGLAGMFAPEWLHGNIQFNFGQGGQTGLTYDAASGGRFKYTPPTGFKALCTANLLTPTIKNGSQNFNAVTYTGSGANRSIAVGFQPDFVWTKCRNQNAYHHVINDSVRGAGKDLFSDITDAESAARTDCLTSWTSNGYSLGADAGTALWNWNNNTYVAWCWRAGTVKTSGWSGGTVTPTKESYNPTAGLSIISYTGTGTAGTLPHSLGAAPAFIVQKSRADASASWIMYHQAMGASNYILFDTSAAATSAVMWNSTAPTTSVLSVGNHIYSNNSGSNYIVYLWTEVPGFSKFGSYTGNGSSDGPFVYCGFKPAYILIKRIDAAGYNWEIHDNKRDSYNQAENFLYANLANSEATSSDQKLDILSNGFKLRNTGATINGGGTYIFAAFAEAPFKYATAR